MEDRYNIPGYDPELLRVTDDIKAKYYPEPSYKAGDIVTHEDGRQVRIEDGRYWVGEGPLRRLSNSWSWHPVDANGEPSGPRESGYGHQLVDPNPPAAPSEG
jgi:hypothetical protein